MFYMQATGLVLLSICLPWLGGWGHLHDGSGWQPWAWGIFAGCINAFSTLTLYRSFEVGKMAVVAPLSASYPALTVILSLLSGERLTAARAAGIICTMLGIVLVARGEQAPHVDDVEGNKRSGKGLGWALCSALGFGVLFWLLGNRIVPRVGAPQTVWMIRLTCVFITGIILLLAKQSDRSAARPGALVRVGHGPARHWRVRGQQSRHAARAGRHRQRARFALRRGYRGPGGNFLEGARCQMAMGGYRHYFRGHPADQLVAGSPLRRQQTQLHIAC